MQLTDVMSTGQHAAMLSAVVDHAGLGELFDHVLSVEEVGVYKPPPKVYQLACDQLGIPAEAITNLFTDFNHASSVTSKKRRQLIWSPAVRHQARTKFCCSSSACSVCGSSKRDRSAWTLRSSVMRQS